MLILAAPTLHPHPLHAQPQMGCLGGSSHPRCSAYKPAAEPNRCAESLLFLTLAQTPSLWCVHAKSRRYTRETHNTHKNKEAQEEQANGHKRCKTLAVLNPDTWRAQPFLLPGRKARPHLITINLIVPQIICTVDTQKISSLSSWTRLFYALKLSLCHFKPWQNLPHDSEGQVPCFNEHRINKLIKITYSLISRHQGHTSTTC